jgi:hypothetical protein
MEKQSREIPLWLLIFISPTRFIFEVIRRAKIRYWSPFFLFIALSLVLVNPLLHTRNWPHSILLGFLWLLPVSRIVEVSYAFLADALGFLEDKPKRTELTPVQRIQLLGMSYVEVGLNFALIYLSFPLTSFSKPFGSPMQAFYFSWMTLTTTGYGDFTPQTDLARFLCVVEVGIGLMLIVLAVGAYLSADKSKVT